MFNLKLSSEVAGDGTASYDVILNKEYTVWEFVQEVLSRTPERGEICIGEDVFNCVYVCGYRYGVLMSEFDESFKDLKVASIRAHGGWSLMDYFLTVEEKENEMDKQPSEYSFIIKNAEYRPCRVDGKDAMFHRWTTVERAFLESDVSYNKDGQTRIRKDFEESGVVPNFCKVKKVILNFGIVEYRDGTIEEVEPSNIQFLDSEILFRETAGFEKEEVKDGTCDEM